MNLKGIKKQFTGTSHEQYYLKGGDLSEQHPSQRMNINEYNFIQTPILEEDTPMDESMSSVNQEISEAVNQDKDLATIELQVFWSFNIWISRFKGTGDVTHTNILQR